MRNFEIVKEGAILPIRATQGSAGYDFFSNEETFIRPGETKLVKTGVTVNMTTNEVLMVCSRSGLALKKGVFALNAPGIVDSDYYPNEIGVILHNAGSEIFDIKHGDRIAQGVFSQFLIVEGDEAELYSIRDGGFGSTGK